MRLGERMPAETSRVDSTVSLGRVDARMANGHL
jgi:hypothetical protein